MNKQTQEALKNFDWDKVNRKTEDDILTMVSDFQSGRIHNVELAERIAKRCEATFLIACKEALEQPAQEPVAWLEVIDHYGHKTSRINLFDKGLELADGTNLYTHPHQWQGLTDDEAKKIIAEFEPLYDGYGMLCAIEQALRSKNE